jgi:hypothetical protein
MHLLLGGRRECCAIKEPRSRENYMYGRYCRLSTDKNTSLHCIVCSSEYPNDFSESRCTDCGNPLIDVRSNEILADDDDDSDELLETSESELVDQEARNRFAIAYTKMANRNGVGISAAAVAGVVGWDIDTGADFVNVYRNLIDKKEILIFTTKASHSLRMGILGGKCLWTVEHEDVRDVRSDHGTARNYVFDNLVIDTDDGTYPFGFGFFSTSY